MRVRHRVIAILALGLLAGGVVNGAAFAAPTDKGRRSAPALPGTGSKDPVNIDADKLDYFDKEQKLIYTGNVVAVQGDSTLKATKLTIFLDRDQSKPATDPKAAPKDSGAETAVASAMANGSAPDAAPAQGQSSVKYMEAEGPVTLVSKDQVGTGDFATYDKVAGKVTMKGHVTLTQGTSVTKGDRLIYDTSNGEAQVFSDPGKRIGSVFVPGSGSSAPGDAKPAAPPPAKAGSGPAAKKKRDVKAKDLGTASAQ